VSEYVVERMLVAGATKICFVIAPGKADIVQYYGGRFGDASLCYVVQPEPDGLCDALFRALPVVGDDEDVVVGLPDTVWFPRDGMARLPPGRFSFLLFPVTRPDLFDAVLHDGGNRVTEIEVKRPKPRTQFVWGAFRLPGRTLKELHALWVTRAPRDPYLGTLDGYREAIGLLTGADDV